MTNYIARTFQRANRNINTLYLLHIHLHFSKRYFKNFQMKTFTCRRRPLLATRRTDVANPPCLSPSPCRRMEDTLPPSLTTSRISYPQLRASIGKNRPSESPVPFPLPMPAYGGYFAPLTDYLPDILPPTPGFHR